MDHAEFPALHTLSAEEHAALTREVERVKATFGFQHEMLSLEELAKVIGKQVNYLWNLRARGQMIGIPARRVGGHDSYWIVHVVQWMSQSHRVDSTSATAAPPPPHAAPARPATRRASRLPAKGSKSTDLGQAATSKKGPGRRRDSSPAKDALIARGLALLAKQGLQDLD